MQGVIIQFHSDTPQVIVDTGDSSTVVIILLIVINICSWVLFGLFVFSWSCIDKQKSTEDFEVVEEDFRRTKKLESINRKKQKNLMKSIVQNNRTITKDEANSIQKYDESKNGIHVVRLTSVKKLEEVKGIKIRVSSVEQH